MKKGYRLALVIICLVFFLSAGAFVYTFVQPRFTATITEVGSARSVTSRSRRVRRRKSYTVVDLTVAYTDRGGNEQTAEVSYERPESTLSTGQQLVIVKGLRGFIRYPNTKLRWISGFFALGAGMFLLFSWMDRKPKPEGGGKP